jgi:hypothetical protein
LDVKISDADHVQVISPLKTIKSTHKNVAYLKIKKNSSSVARTHMVMDGIVDILKSMKINIVMIFSPEISSKNKCPMK